MTSIGLGSCVAVILYDPRNRIGAVAHVMLPESGGKCDRPGKYADTAIPLLMNEMIQNGSVRRSLVAKIAGGSSMFQNFSGNLNIGDRNVAAIRQILESFGIPLVAEDTGGTVGRSIQFFPLEGGGVRVRRADGTCTEI
ncbi:MAG: chemotaxis protein CheD [Methanomicrobiales archaeon]|nr:chemotaxis protein CheD [Methanomicrobiales archaeon]